MTVQPLIGLYLGVPVWSRVRLASVYRMDTGKLAQDANAEVVPADTTEQQAGTSGAEDVKQQEQASGPGKTQDEPAQPPGSPAAQTPDRREQRRLVFASFLMLFVELALIRWVTSNNVYVTKATNFVLLASFLGIGVGFLNAKSSRNYLRWTPVALLALVAFVLAFPVILSSLSGVHPYQGLKGMGALPQPVSLSVIFLLVVGVMAGIGQGVAQIFVGFRPLAAYRLDIAGSIGGIVVFSLLSFLDLPPFAWGVIAAAGLLLLVAPHVRWWQVVAVLGVVALLGVESFVPSQQWSPYNKLSYYRTGGPDSVLNVSANNIPYQAARSLAQMHTEKPFYFYPYRHVTRASLKNVLIIGA